MIIMKGLLIQYRHEFKYVISDLQVEILKNRISGLIPLDPNCMESGSYIISSLYLDDYYNSCYYDNENGVDPRKKFRIRAYNHNPELIKLECKKKECEKTLKQSSKITGEEVTALMSSDESVGFTDKAVKNIMILEAKRHLLRPVTIVEYERIPYIYKDGNVRVTFDLNISASKSVNRFLKFDYPTRPIMPVGYQLLEVKYDAYCPDFIFRALQLEELQRTAFSKYYLCRKIHL